MDQETKDNQLVKIAKRKNIFKYHVLIYFIMNLIFWTMWYIRLKNDPGSNPEKFPFPWPVWIMLIWGIGLLFNYFSAYKSYTTEEKNIKN